MNYYEYDIADSGLLSSWLAHSEVQDLNYAALLWAVSSIIQCVLYEL